MAINGDTGDVVFLNPFTCGIYKDGGTRYKIDLPTGIRTEEIDNQLGEQVDQFVEGHEAPGVVRVKLEDIFSNQVLVPKYYDNRWLDDFQNLLSRERLTSISLGELEKNKILKVRGGHGSPGNDNRNGNIPYVKVSDIRSLRVNVNPTNLVSKAVAESFWRGVDSGLRAWDLITPNRASSNIGEFAVLLPGEEPIVITKEVFVLRLLGDGDTAWDPFYLLWALCLKAVRKQWQRIALMQTNREDVGQRYREILLPKPHDIEWAKAVSAPFRDYFTSLAVARTTFVSSLSSSGYEYIASAHATGRVVVGGENDYDEDNLNGDSSTDEM